MNKTIKLYNNTVVIDFTESNHAYYLLNHNDLTKTGTPRKKRLKGVTSYIDIISKPALIPWAVNKTVEYFQEHIDLINSGKIDIREVLYGAGKAAEDEKTQAADIGKQIHEWIEKHIKGGSPEMPQDARVLEGALGFLEWKERNRVKFLESEKIVYSKAYDYIGTFDIEVEIDGKRYLVDIKTGNGIYKEARLQTAAYVKADEEESGKVYAGRYVLRISKENKEEYFIRMEKKGKKDFPEFKQFEFIYLDDEPGLIDVDYAGFLNCVKLSNWKKNAKI